MRKGLSNMPGIRPEEYTKRLERCTEAMKQHNKHEEKVFLSMDNRSILLRRDEIIEQERFRLSEMKEAAGFNCRGRQDRPYDVTHPGDRQPGR